MSLLEHISFHRPTRAIRNRSANWVISHPESFLELLDYAFKKDKDYSHKANWVLEIVCLNQLDLLIPHLNYFFEELPKVTDDSSVRPLSHICELLAVAYYKKRVPSIRAAFKESHKEKMIDCCFDWLITHQKVACEVRAMTCLYYIGTEHSWIHPELQMILETKIPNGSAGYQSRRKKTLNDIQRFATRK